MKNGGVIPDVIKNKVEILDRNLEFYLDQFFLLESERVMGMVVGAIPVTKIYEWGLNLGYSRKNVWFFVELMVALDRVALKYYNKVPSHGKPKKKS